MFEHILHRFITVAMLDRTQTHVECLEEAFDTGVINRLMPAVMPYSSIGH